MTETVNYTCAMLIKIIFNVAYRDRHRKRESMEYRDSEDNSKERESDMEGHREFCGWWCIAVGVSEISKSWPCLHGITYVVFSGSRVMTWAMNRNEKAREIAFPRVRVWIYGSQPQSMSPWLDQLMLDRIRLDPSLTYSYKEGWSSGTWDC